jgi:exonuclease
VIKDVKKGTWVMVDVETDGPIPGDFSMIAVGAVIVEPGLERSFHGQLRPISEKWIPEALNISGPSPLGLTREQTLDFPPALGVMLEFDKWIAANVKGRPLFISDNNGFDFQFVNWYFWHFLGKNPFGHSSTNLGSLYKGMVKDVTKNFKHLRVTKHDHNPVNDARGNAESFLYMIEVMGLFAPGVSDAAWAAATECERLGCTSLQHVSNCSKWIMPY